MVKPKRLYKLINEEHKQAICQQITCNYHLELENIQVVVDSVFSIRVSILFNYSVIRWLKFFQKNLMVSPYKRHISFNIETCCKYAEMYTALKGKCTIKFYHTDKLLFMLSMCNLYRCVTNCTKYGVCRQACVCFVSCLIVALGSLGVKMYQMFKDSHNKGTLIRFIQLLQKHLRSMSWGSPTLLYCIMLEFTG